MDHEWTEQAQNRLRTNAFLPDMAAEELARRIAQSSIHIEVRDRLIDIAECLAANGYDGTVIFVALSNTAAALPR